MPAASHSADLGRLVDVIHQGIAARGVYLLMDERLDLICGPDALQNRENPEVKQRISNFSARHGWAVTSFRDGFLFLPTGAEMDFSSF